MDAGGCSKSGIHHPVARKSQTVDLASAGMAKFWVSETQQSHKLINKLINFKINKIDKQQEPTI